jgi:hypothetical protein
MKLTKALVIGRACDLETTAECVNNILLHTANLFVYGDIEDEVRELKIDAADVGILFCGKCGMAMEENQTECHFCKILIHADEGKGTSACRVCGADVQTDGAQQDVVCPTHEEIESQLAYEHETGIKRTHCDMRGDANCKACSDGTCPLRVTEAD